jgi:histidine ammonia-lyase
MTIQLDGPGVTIANVVAVARQGERVELTPAALDAMETARATVERLAEGAPNYGISTGFGALATVSIPPERRRSLQAALVRSHAAGMGDPVEDEVVRAMMLLRARTLALGYSGARPLVAQGMVDLLNAGISPVVPEYGSLGASGDLAPLAHGALALLGEGEVDHDGRRRPAANALADAGLEPIVLAEKEGLAVTNGTDAILGMLCLAIDDTARLLVQADAITAMTVEGLLATASPFAADLQAIRPQPGQAISAANLVTMLAGSPIVASHDTPRRRAGAGCLLNPLHALGARGGARHAGPLHLGRRLRAGLRHRQSDGAARRPGRVVRQLPRGSAWVCRRLPGHRRLRDRCDR